MNIELHEPIEQLTHHLDFDSAFERAQFPYYFGQLTHIRVWINRTKKGESITYSCFNPDNNKWSEVKEKGAYPLVFMFKDEANNFIFDEFVDLNNVGTLEVLHIAEHYILTPEQKEAISKRLNYAESARYMAENNLRLIWRPEYAHNTVRPLRKPTSSLFKPYPCVVMPERKVVNKRPPGRPKAVAEVKQADDYKPLVPQTEGLITLWSTQQATLLDDIVMRLRENDKPVNCESVIAQLTEVFTLRSKALENMRTTYANSKLVAGGKIDNMGVDLGQSHHAGNNHIFTSAYWERVELADQTAQVKLLESWNAVMAQLNEYPF